MRMGFCWGKVKGKRDSSIIKHDTRKVEASLYPLTVVSNDLLSNAF
jgi:hypothetical protein